MVLDHSRLWNGQALQPRHIWVALSPAGTMDSQNPLRAGSATDAWVNVYPEQLSPFLQQHLHFLKRGLTLHGQGHKTLGELEDFPWQPPDGGKRR